MSPQKLYLSSLVKGLQTDSPPFFLDNDAFSLLENAYIFRKRIVKKRGTQTLGRLERELTNQSIGNTSGPGSVSVNIKSLLSLETNACFAPSTITITVGGQTFTEPVSPNGTLSNGGSGTGTINYSTMTITLQTAPVLAATPVTITFGYYPALPAMGDEDYLDNATAASAINLPVSIFFDTKYAYTFNYTSRKFQDESFYKGPAPQTPIVWTGDNWQQFWSCNYQNALFVTNNVPGMHFKTISAITMAAAAQITITGHNLNVNSQIWINEVQGMSQINGLTGTVQSIVDANNVTVNINSSAFTAYTAGGIAQYLNNSIPGQGGIRWYDGTGAGFGFVNFAPPLQVYNSSTLPTPSYLVGARLIIAYRSKLLCFGTFEMTSGGSVIYYRNRVRWSQIGTVYYSSLTPTNQTYQQDAWIDNLPGKGGFLDIDTNEKILSVAVNQEVLILGLEQTQRKISATGNALDPYIVQTVNPEWGTESSYASIALDTGILSVGDYAFVLTTSYNAQRIDNIIPDQIYQIKNTENSNERVSGIRDFKNELVYFTYCSFDNNDVFPNRSIVFNYREGNWATFREEYTTYGYFRDRNSITWRGSRGRIWRTYAQTWASGRNAERYPNICGGNQQGYFQKKDVGTFNDRSHFIQALTGNTITSPNHNRKDGDFIYIQNCVGSTNLNLKIAQVTNVVNVNVFTINLIATGTYFGLGEFAVVDNFTVKTAMLPLYWQEGMGARVGAQKYLLNTTDSGEFTVDIYTSQNSGDAVNDPLNTPFQICSNIVRTRPDDSLGLHDTAYLQAQIWHRTSASYTGDSIQMAFHYSDDQMQDIDIVRSDWVFYAAVIDFYPSRILA